MYNTPASSTCSDDEGKKPDKKEDEDGYEMEELEGKEHHEAEDDEYGRMLSVDYHQDYDDAYRSREMEFE